MGEVTENHERETAASDWRAKNHSAKNLSDAHEKYYQGRLLAVEEGAQRKIKARTHEKTRRNTMNLQEIRNKRGIPLEELAETLEIDALILAGYEEGREPDWDFFHQKKQLWASKLGLKVDELSDYLYQAWSKRRRDIEINKYRSKKSSRLPKRVDSELGMLRVKRRIKQDQLAKILGISMNSLWRYENGHLPRPSVFDKIKLKWAMMLQTTEDELLKLVMRACWQRQAGEKKQAQVARNRYEAIFLKKRQ